jgi:hypothetical protein
MLATGLLQHLHIWPILLRLYNCVLQEKGCCLLWSLYVRCVVVAG